MKKSIFTAFLFLAVGALVLPAQSAQLETSIRDAIVMAPHYGVFDNLSFQLEGSDLTLLGQVLLPITREEISRRVAKLAGVAKVIDKIEVLPVSKSDDLLRMQVYRRLFGTSDLYRYAVGSNPSIHIIVKGGHVTLEGVVSTEGDGRIALMAARKVTGAFSITSNLKSEK